MYSCVCVCACSASVDLLNDLLVHVKKVWRYITLYCGDCYKCVALQANYSQDVLEMLCSPLLECMSEDLSISCNE